MQFRRFQASGLGVDFEETMVSLRKTQIIRAWVFCMEVSGCSIINKVVILCCYPLESKSLLKQAPSRAPVDLPGELPHERSGA